MENPAVFHITITDTDIRAIQVEPSQDMREDINPKELKP